MGMIEKLAADIGYPDPVKGPQAVFRVDDGDVRVREESGRIVFERTICTPEEGADTLARLAGFAAGRLLKEEAVLAWDPTTSSVILWQSAPASAGSGAVKRIFEVFLTSCDWWLARLDEEGRRTPSFPEMTIVP